MHICPGAWQHIMLLSASRKTSYICTSLQDLQHFFAVAASSPFWMSLDQGVLMSLQDEELILRSPVAEPACASCMRA